VTIFNVAGMLQEPPGATREVLLRDRYLALGSDVELAGPVDGKLRLQRTNRGILLRGFVDAPVRRNDARSSPRSRIPRFVRWRRRSASIGPASSRSGPRVV